MRKLFILTLVALLLGVGVVAVIETDPGYILVTYGNYTLETSLWVGLLLLLLLTLLIYALVRLVNKLIAGQHSLTSWFGSRKAQRASRATTRGLISFIEGNWSNAQRQLLRGTRDNDAPLVNYLLAARASYRLNDPDKVQEYLGAAGASASEAETAVALTRAELQLEAGEHEQAIATLTAVRKDAGRHPYVLELLYRAYRDLEDWENLATLLPELKKHKTLPEAELRQLENETWVRRLEQSVTDGEGPAGARLQSAWDGMPNALRRQPEVVRSYARMLMEQGEYALAGKVIVNALKHDWDPELVRLYGFIPGDNAQRQLGQAESWLTAHPDDAELLLCLGRLSARDKLWGKARDYFERSYRLERRPETCAELGRLLVALGEPKVAAAYFREGLLLRESGLPTLPMPEKVVSPSHRLAPT